MTDWLPISTIPRRTKVRVKTRTGLERIAYVPDYTEPRLRNNCLAISGFGRTPKGSTGDLAIIGWLPL